MTPEEYSNLKIKDVVLIEGNANSKDKGCCAVVRGFVAGKVVVTIDPDKIRRYSWRHLKFIYDLENK